ncbi:MAG: hypothetical protein QME96_06295 [Myxococcota bacterium]|nr:hypothetical protein [Myxococcota bacterium]
MPVERYRDVSDMPAPPRVSGEDRVRRIREVLARAVRLAGSAYPPGVHLFRSLEDAREARDAVVRARTLARRAAR